MKRASTESNRARMSVLYSKWPKNNSVTLTLEEKQDQGQQGVDVRIEEGMESFALKLSKCTNDWPLVLCVSNTGYPQPVLQCLILQ